MPKRLKRQVPTSILIPEDDAQDQNIAPGQYWPNNLAAPPFSLIPKRNFSEEFDGKYLYLYDRAALAEELARRGKLSAQPPQRR